jgi:ABC-type lipoprotein release transport system permease subunit
MFASMLITAGIALGGVALLVAVALLWSWRQQRKEAKMLRERSPHATLPPHPRHEDTDRWNLTR